MERLRGTNFGGWLSQLDAIEEKDPAGFPGPDAHMKTFIGEPDFSRVARWGFNHVRVPIDHEHFFDEEGNPLDGRIRFIDDAVAFAQGNRLSIILDLHKCPGHTFHDPSKAVQALFTDDTYVARTERIWEYLAGRYGGFTSTIFEILNEPVAPDAAVWNRIKDRLALAIRKVAPRTPIVVGSNMWNWPATYDDFTPAPVDNVIYSVHFYEPLLFTHQKAPWMGESEFLETRDYPADYGPGVVRQYDMRQSEGKWDKARMEADLAPVFRFRDTHQAPIICNEFGTYVQAPREPQLRWLKDFLDVLKANDVGFSYWNYKNLDFGIFSKGESLHEDLERYKNPKRMDDKLLAILREG